MKEIVLDSPYDFAGKVSQSMGLIFEATLPDAAVGSHCEVDLNPRQSQKQVCDAEVIGFRNRRAILMPFDLTVGVNGSSVVRVKRSKASITVGYDLLGRVIDAKGDPIDDKGPLFSANSITEERSLYQKPSNVMKREVIKKPLDLGVKAINSLLTCGEGQRMGIMAGSGVGKSVLLGMMAKNTSADVNVIALIGERGREVREFIERDLGPEGMKRSIVVVATSDTSPLLRMRGAFLASSIAEYFRDQGKNVLLMMDSVTRFCMAQREIGLSLGEPPASKGYTPSVFSTLPKLLERAGTGIGKGSITGLYTVLVDGDDMDEPIADATRSILDGHIVLSRKIANRNHFPAIDVLASISRVMPSITSDEHRLWAGKLREWISAYQQAEDLINVGAYVKGSSPKIDQAIAIIDRLNEFLKQGINDKFNFDQTLGIMLSLVRAAESSDLGRKNIQSS